MAELAFILGIHAYIRVGEMFWNLLLRLSDQQHVEESKTIIGAVVFAIVAVAWPLWVPVFGLMALAGVVWAMTRRDGA